MPPLLDDQIGIATVTLPASGFVQLPNILCKEIYIAGTSGNITLAQSATPGNNVITLGTGTAGGIIWLMIPTGGNASNLFMSGSSGVVVPFLWRNPRIQMVAMGA